MVQLSWKRPPLALLIVISHCGILGLDLLQLRKTGVGVSVEDASSSKQYRPY